MQEFDMIARYLEPLTDGKSHCLSLNDDAALLPAPPTGKRHVIAADSIQESVHFVGDETASAITYKLMATNLSDMAAMGATPIGYLLTFGLPRQLGEAWINECATALRTIQDQYHIHLIGGDTTNSKQHLNLSATLIGTVPEDKMLTRSGAQIDDILYVSGTIGDATLGLQVALGNPFSALDKMHNDYLLERYRRPTPRIALGQELLNLGATSCMDISDGLLPDLQKLCRASQVSADVAQVEIPLSPSAQLAMRQNCTTRDVLLSGGDDYELLFTLPPAIAATLDATKLATPVYRIGTIAGAGTDSVRLLDEQGKKIALSTETLTGWQHQI